MNWRVTGMSNPLAGRITLQVVIRILVTIVTVLLATLWMAARQNEQAHQATLTMVRGGLAACRAPGAAARGRPAAVRGGRAGGARPGGGILAHDASIQGPGASQGR